MFFLNENGNIDFSAHDAFQDITEILLKVALNTITLTIAL